MTKVPWKEQETSLEVYVATKAGQCVSFDQMILAQVGFIAQNTHQETLYSGHRLRQPLFKTEVHPPDDQAQL